MICGQRNAACTPIPIPIPIPILVLVLVLIPILVPAVAVLAAGSEPTSAREFYSYDRDAPLDPRLSLVSENAWYRHFELTYSSEGDTVICHYFEPLGEGSKQALIGVHGMFSPREDQFWFIADFLARRGYAVLMPSLPYHHRRAKGVQLMSGQQFIITTPERIKENFRRSVVDIRRGLDWLAARPGVQPDNIGIVGASLGGMIAVLAYKVEERFSCGLFMVAGGGLSDILRSSQTPVVEAFRKAASFGLLDLGRTVSALSAADPANVEESRVRDVLMFNGRKDIIFPIPQVEALFRTLGNAQIVWADSGHFYPVYAAEYLMVAFLENRNGGAAAALRSGVGGEMVFEEVPRAPVPGEDRLWVDVTVRGAPGGGRPAGPAWEAPRRHVLGVSLLNRVLPTVIVERSVFDRWGGHGWNVPAMLYVVEDVTTLDVLAALCYIRDMGWLAQGVRVVWDEGPGATVRQASFDCEEAHLLLAACSGLSASRVLGGGLADAPAPLAGASAVREFPTPRELADDLRQLVDLARTVPLPALPEDEQLAIRWPADFVVEATGDLGRPH